MPGAFWLARRSSRGSQGGGFPDEGSEQRRFVVWTLGRELRVWNQWRAARIRDGFADGTGLLRARRGVAPSGAEGRRKFRRIVAELRNGFDQGPGQQHTVADCVGPDWVACRRGSQRPRDWPRRRLPGTATTRQRFLERRRLHGHGIPRRVLPEISPV